MDLGFHVTAPDVYTIDLLYCSYLVF